MFIPGYQALDIHATDTGLHLIESCAAYNLDVNCRALWEQLPHGSIIPCWRLHEMIGNIDQLIMTHILCRIQHNTESQRRLPSTAEAVNSSILPSARVATWHTYLEMIPMAMLPHKRYQLRTVDSAASLNHHDVQVVVQPLPECCPEHGFGLHKVEQRRHCLQYLDDKGPLAKAEEVEHNICCAPWRMPAYPLVLRSGYDGAKISFDGNAHC